MELKSDPNKITFIVDTLCTIGFEYKGASISLHRMAYELASKGHYVYIFNEPYYPHPNIEVIPTRRTINDGGWWSNFEWELMIFNSYRTVTLYTQLTWGNPFSTIHNARWILHDYEPDQWSSYDPEDYIYNFGTFKVPEGTKQTELTIFDYNFDKFYNTNNPNRKGFGHIIHKFTPEWGRKFLKNFGSTEIPHFNGRKNLDYLVEEFNKYEYLLTFDDKSYYTSAAALCGTKSIILNPKENITPFEYRMNNPIQMCGVAYGMNDIKWADETIGLVRENLLQLEQRDKKTIDNFIEDWNKKIYEWENK